MRWCASGRSETRTYSFLVTTRRCRDRTISVADYLNRRRWNWRQAQKIIHRNPALAPFRACGFRRERRAFTGDPSRASRPLRSHVERSHSTRLLETTTSVSRATASDGAMVRNRWRRHPGASNLISTRPSNGMPPRKPSRAIQSPRSCVSVGRCRVHSCEANSWPRLHPNASHRNCPLAGAENCVGRGFSA